MYQQTTDLPILAPPQRDHSYLHTIQAGALLPLMQAGILAISLGLLVTILAFSTRAYEPFTWGASTTIVTFLSVYLFLIRHWLTLTVEHVTGLDLNHDNHIGAPPESETTRIEVITQTPQKKFLSESIYTLPASKEQLSALAFGIQSGVTFSEAYWTGKGAPFSLRQFRELRAEMIRRGLLIQTNPASLNQGFTLTPEGKMIISHYAPPSPTIDQPQDTHQVARTRTHARGKRSS